MFDRRLDRVRLPVWVSEFNWVGTLKFCVGLLSFFIGQGGAVYELILGTRSFL